MSAESLHRRWKHEITSLFNGGEQPLHVQFCRIFRREQSGSSLVSLIGHCSAGDTSLLLMADPATTTSLTVRLTQQSQTTTSPLSQVMRLSLCSHQVSNCLVCAHVGEVVFGRRWLSCAMVGTSYSAAQCRSTIFISRISSMTTGSLDSWCMKCWRWRGTPFSAVSRHSQPAQHCRASTGASALFFCATLPPQRTCRLTARSSPATAGPDSQAVVR